MSLWADKHRPTTLKQLTHHADLTKQLTSLAGSGTNFPHLLIHGPQGSGKKTRVMAILRALYGTSAAEKMKVDVRTVQTMTNSGTAGRKIEFNVISSSVHLEITPSDVGNWDRVVVSEVVKDVGGSEALDFTLLRSNKEENNDNNNKDKPKFKVVVINAAEKLTHDAQASLRRTMEKYSATVRLILLCDTTSPIIDPIKSRTLSIRIPLPTTEELSLSLNSIVNEEKEAQKVFPEDWDEREVIFKHLCLESSHNTRLAIMMLEAMVMNNEQITENTKPIKPDWWIVIEDLSRAVLKDRSVSRLTQARGVLYELLAHAIPGDIILSKLVMGLMKIITDEGIPGLSSSDPMTYYRIKMGIVDAGSKFDERLKNGSKDIFHLEGFLARVMVVIEQEL
ncbi:replication factor C subunit 5 [Martiniozyma asiatica (nom. inval.)]|nr:replication factor C subunit 5 [Martiniozyma asiatica]